MDNLIEKIIQYKKELQAILISLFFSFTLCIFGPLELYINNQEELWFGIEELIVFIVMSAIVSFSMLLIAMLYTKFKYNEYVRATIFGVALALYLQGNILTINYGVLDGKTINWSMYSNWAIFNSLIWLVCIAISLILAKKDRQVFCNITSAVSAFIITIQAITLCVLVLTVGLGEKSNVTLTTEGMFDVSKNKNVAVFVLDTMDATYFEEALATYPELEQIFTDFTYYNNALGAYPTTKAAMPQILTGKWYENREPYQEYIQKAWAQNPLVSELQENKFSCGIYTLSNFVDSEASIDNLQRVETGVSSYKALYMEYAKFTLFKYIPHILKKYCVINTENFESLKSIDNNLGNVYDFDTRSVWETLREKGINDCNKNTFRLYHYMGSHPPYTINEDLNIVGEGRSSVASQTRGSLSIIQEYIRLLKSQGYYENSMIVVMSDHGAVGTFRQNPAFLIKYPQEKHKFEVSEAPISYQDLQATFISGISEDYQAYGKSMRDIEFPRERRYLYYTWDDSWDKQYLPEMKEFTTSVKAREMTNEDSTDIFYTENGIENRSVACKYNWGQKFSFVNYDDRQLIKEGISGVEENFAWSLGERTIVRLELKQLPKSDIKLTLAIPFVLGEKQTIRLLVNQKYIGTYEVSNKKTKVPIIIPKEYITEKELELTFEYPDARAPKDLGINQDTRVLAVALRNLTLSIEDVYKDSLNITSEHIIDFKEGGNSDVLNLVGWYSQESFGIWTSEKSEITFYATSTNDIEMSTDFAKLVQTGETKVLINNNEIAQWSNSDSRTETIIIPKELLQSNKKQTITFVTAEAKTPKELGINEDTRKLGIFVSGITFKSVD